ncbi:GIY-YIG nuclease family protein [Paenibacillus beijingensis]|uniref:GIY-YIG nuclease family protein n=1 Tax=Paenibacillus beijingensis TaxID=1126833 RepID=UPI0006971712|nr:GIY-YIG nuclease family protein [Paenibacillus beijingensis]
MNAERRKMLVAQYQEQEREMGVYRIVNRKNGRSFIDSTLNMKGAWQRDRFMLDMGGHPNKELQQEWKATGGEGFEFELLEIYDPGEKVTFDYRDVLPKDEAPRTGTQRKYKKGIEELEEAWLNKLQPFAPDGYHPPRQEADGKL